MSARDPCRAAEYTWNLSGFGSTVGLAAGKKTERGSQKVKIIPGVSCDNYYTRSQKEGPMYYTGESIAVPNL